MSTKLGIPCNRRGFVIIESGADLDSTTSGLLGQSPDQVINVLNHDVERAADPLNVAQVIDSQDNLPSYHDVVRASDASDSLNVARDIIVQIDELHDRLERDSHDTHQRLEEMAAVLQKLSLEPLLEGTPLVLHALQSDEVIVTDHAGIDIMILKYKYRNGKVPVISQIIWDLQHHCCRGKFTDEIQFDAVDAGDSSVPCDRSLPDAFRIKMK